MSEAGLTVLEGPVNAVYPGSAAAKAGFETPYTTAVVQRDAGGAVTAVYCTATVPAPHTDKVLLGLDGNAAIQNELTAEYGKYLDDHLQ